MKKVVTGIIAGLVVFLWVMISWMVLPWHKPTFEKFKNDTAAKIAITQLTGKSGLYIYPNMDTPPSQAMTEPHFFLSAHLEGKDFKTCMLFGLLIQCFAGVVITCMVTEAKLSAKADKVKMVMKAAVFAALVGVLPDWNWWSVPMHYTLIGILDLLIGWFLAAQVIAKRVSA